MSLDPNELFSQNTRNSRPRVQIGRIQPKTLAAGVALLAILTPLARLRASGFFAPWVAAIAGVDTITFTPTVSGGTYKLTLNGAQTAAIAYNASAAAVQAALELLGTVKPGDVVASGGAGPTNIVLTYANRFLGNRPTLVIADSTTGGGNTAIVQTVAGSESDGSDEITAFLWPDNAQLLAGNEIIGDVLMSGTIHIDDIPLTGSNTLPQLKAALLSVRQKDFLIQGMQGFA